MGDLIKFPDKKRPRVDKLPANQTKAGKHKRELPSGEEAMREVKERIAGLGLYQDPRWNPDNIDLRELAYGQQSLKDVNIDEVVKDEINLIRELMLRTISLEEESPPNSLIKGEIANDVEDIA